MGLAERIRKHFRREHQTKAAASNETPEQLVQRVLGHGAYTLDCATCKRELSGSNPRSLCESAMTLGWKRVRLTKPRFPGDPLEGWACPEHWREYSILPDLTPEQMDIQ